MQPVFDGMAVLQKLKIPSSATFLVNVVTESVWGGNEHWQQACRRSLRRVSRGIDQECRKIEKSARVYVWHCTTQEHPSCLYSEVMKQAAQCHSKQARDCQIPRLTVEDRSIQRQAWQLHHVRDNRRSVLESRHTCMRSCSRATMQSRRGRYAYGSPCSPRRRYVCHHLWQHWCLCQYFLLIAQASQSATWKEEAHRPE